MLHRSLTLIFSLFVFSSLAFSQNTDATTRPPQSTAPTPDTTAKPTATPRPRRAVISSAASGGTDTASVEGVIAAFDALVNGIERSDVEAVMSLYWNSPELTIYNNNGTVTKSWDQLRSNRASAYPYAKDVKLEIRNRNVYMVGREGAVVTCQWAQTQFFHGNPESAAGRLTVVFRRLGSAWKITHTHTSPEAPDPSRLMTSERNAGDADTPQQRPRQ